jgi:hypothetical protein
MMFQKKNVHAWAIPSGPKLYSGLATPTEKKNEKF